MVAQRLNFTHAARQLHLTQGAVSRQNSGWNSVWASAVQPPARFGVDAAGAQLPAPAAGAGAVGRGADAGRRPAGALRIKCPTCAMRWVLPRIIRPQNERPDMHIELTAFGVARPGFQHRASFDAAVIAWPAAGQS
ncbi:LysR family transcriptional regulator [Serratia ureilytica]